GTCRRRHLRRLYAAAAAARTEGAVQGMAGREFPGQGRTCALAGGAEPRRAALRLDLVEANDRRRSLCRDASVALRPCVPQTRLQPAHDAISRHDALPTATAERRPAGSVLSVRIGSLGSSPVYATRGFSARIRAARQYFSQTPHLLLNYAPGRNP